jgi:hypothetical protein
MSKNSFLATLLISLSFFCINTFAQEKILSTRKITMLYNEATLLMKDEQYEKSLIQSRLALQKYIILLVQILTVCPNLTKLFFTITKD